MIEDIVHLCGTRRPEFLQSTSASSEMTVVRLLRRCVNQTGIRRRILRFELADAFEVVIIGDCALGECLQLVRLT
jgi:hypothetical protein